MIVLRDYREADAERLMTLLAHADVSRYLSRSFASPYTLADAQAWIRDGSKHHGAVTRVIAYQGVFVGSIAVTPQPGWHSHVGKIGYWIARDHWGRGIAGAALTHMSAYAFETLSLRKLFAPVLAPNSASMRVLEKAGFALEAVLKADVQVDGVDFDVHRFSRHRG